MFSARSATTDEPVGVNVDVTEEAVADAPITDDGPTPEWMADAPEPGSNADLEEKLRAAQKAYSDLSGADGGKMLFIFLLLAAACNLALSIIKRWRQLSDYGKKYLPWAALGLGIIVGFAAYAGTGAGILESAFYGAGPPLAVLLQELFHPIRSMPK
jgi:hypothetical protein